MIDPRTQVYMFVLGLAVLAFVLNLVRTRKLQERYALLWVLAGLALAVAPLAIHWLDAVAYALGFDYPPALLLMLAVIGLLLIIFQLSLNLSHNANHLKLLTQELALLRQEVSALEARLDVPTEPAAHLQPAPGVTDDPGPPVRPVAVDPAMPDAWHVRNTRHSERVDEPTYSARCVQ